jgi:hypothetical protein
MKNKLIILSLIIVLISSLKLSFGWGNKAHRLVNVRAMELLPEEMNLMKSWKEYVGDRASDADIRRDNHSDTTEWPKHFIDIDYYAEFIAGKMIYDKDELISLYSGETVTKMGLLPWAALEAYNNLVQSFKGKNRDKVLIFAADLGHYVADGHQPFHTLLNYDGQLTDQKGIHGRYESEMVSRYIDQISNSLTTREVKYVAKPLEYIFDFLTASNFYSPVIFNADKTAYAQAGSHGSDDYYKLMWFRTKHVTINQLSNASGVLASLIYSAWVDAGKPSLEELN